MTEPVSPRYSIKEGGRLPGGKEAVQIVGSELEVIDQEFGDISAQAVVDRARTPGTALNAWDNKAHYFEWNDAAGAEKYREEQARQLIRTVKIVIETGDQKLSTRGFFAIQSDGHGKVYRPVGFVLTDPAAHRQVIDRFQNEILRIDSAYRAYLGYADFATRFAPVFDAVDRVIDDLANEGEPRAVARRRSRYQREGSRVRLVEEKTP